MWIYHSLDILSTIQECFCLYIISRCLCKELRLRSTWCKYIPPIAVAMLTWCLTWHSELGAIKMPLIFIFTIAILKICYKDSIYQSITVTEIWIIVSTMLTEDIGYIFTNWVYQNEQFVSIDGQTFTRWEIYAVCLIARIFILGVTYLLLKNFKYKIQLKDCIILTFAFLIAFVIIIFSTFNTLNLARTADLILYVSSGVLAAIFIMIFMYSMNMLSLREQAQMDKIQIIQLQQQFAYYREKLKNEERVRSVYHDMKNHLLVLESSQDTEATKQMAKQLRSQIVDYEDYIHTGNDFLDIILKDKTEKAREKNIDISISVDFSGIDFMETLDISTIFGNGLDNAIEACEKLSEDKRLITVKALRNRDMLLIVVQNNAEFTASADGGTTKQDTFMHGFGVPNIKKAISKYDGQCIAKVADSMFTLKIMIPISTT